MSLRAVGEDPVSVPDLPGGKWHLEIISSRPETPPSAPVPWGLLLGEGTAASETKQRDEIRRQNMEQ